MLRHGSTFPFVATLVACTIAAGAAAAQTEHDRDSALDLSQAAIGKTLDERVLLDTSGQPFQIAKLRGKPLVVSLIYTSCNHVCPVITRNLARTVSIAQEALGEEAFSVITVGFDWAVDKPDRMRMYAAERGIDDRNWHFLSGDAESIGALSENLGFRFYPGAGGFEHLSQVTIVDGRGTIYRQVYGQDFEPPMLVEPLKELVFDTPKQAGFVEHWVDKFKLFCTVYDPNVGRYKFDYSILMAIFTGVLSLGAVAFFIANELRRAR
jgi:protein SCO1/2